MIKYVFVLRLDVEYQRIKDYCKYQEFLGSYLREMLLMRRGIEWD